MKEQATWDEVHNCEYKLLFLNGKLEYETSLEEMRTKIRE